ncbi:hypothetical protein H4R33_000728 [Dimargaris cristalligena]|uniref:CAP domain-containing protein n=1 Tax=Dimargaris cristalligena TaxID=215637 RepID=A0A4Q0A0X6_9FUNG|nr:hypothetical protein H4R33_000728 [Dimargaris cristalligena]RKP39091.1 CAP domain-containing protein [Dimargaris cristalligena]|eukprot:RKP39091.1 CAP domain-containing protein [Dimargaris cristalligena]
MKVSIACIASLFIAAAASVNASPAVEGSARHAIEQRAEPKFGAPITLSPRDGLGASDEGHLLQRRQGWGRSRGRGRGNNNDDDLDRDYQGGRNSGSNQANNQYMLQLVNNARRRAGLRPVEYDQSLEEMAIRHSQYQANSRDMTHYDPNGSLGDRTNQVGVRWGSVAENVAEGQNSEEDVMDAWMGSSGHRRNILSPSSTATAVAKVGQYWTQVFAQMD